MTVDYHQLKEVVTSITAVLPDVVSFHEQINTSPVPGISRQGHQYTFIVLLQDQLTGILIYFPFQKT